ncbi:MAG TPA: amidohydrolase family protein [Dehalococcoidia bacterium]|nr:amidohydrolase family protein [Dehalococcoidia bacterium]
MADAGAVHYVDFSIDFVVLKRHKGKERAMITVDADGHVEESQAMFDLLDKEYHRRRPIPVELPKDTVYTPMNAFWLIDGEIYPKPYGRGGFFFGTPTLQELAKMKPASIPAQEMTDMDARLRDLDLMGIDQQVVYPTMFLTTTAEDLAYETALIRCYNTFVADACSMSNGRVKFAAIVPIRDVEESIREMRRARELGAVAVMLMGLAWDKTLADRSLYPFYEAAAQLDMPVAVHFGWASPAFTDLFYSEGVRNAANGLPTTFNAAIAPVLMGFFNLMASGIMETFPRLRVAFLEAGSMWAPYLIHQLERATSCKDAASYFREGRAYISCEADEDINYLASWVGEDSIVVASDYPHADFSKEERMTDAIMGREDVPLRVREKILDGNPRTLYGL